MDISQQLSDGGSHFFEHDFAHVPLFDHDWYNPVKTIDWGLVYLGNPSSSHSVPFTSSIEFRMELCVTKKKDACYQLCNHKIELDLSNFWEKKSDSACGVLMVEGEDGPTYMFYVLLKEAVDVALEVKFETTCDRKVQGYVVAYYGDDFFYKCDYPCRDKDSYMALLFLPNTSSVLTNCNIPLIRSMLAVPTKGSLIIKAYLEDESGKVIMKNSCKFKSQLEGCSIGTISGTYCSFKKVRIMQISQENGQKPDKTEHETEKSARDRKECTKAGDLIARRVKMTDAKEDVGCHHIQICGKCTNQRRAEEFLKNSLKDSLYQIRQGNGYYTKGRKTERIKKTKRSKNSQKPTRNKKKTKTRAKGEEFTSRISPTQKEGKSKTPIEVKGLKVTSSQSLKAYFEVLKIQGPSLPKEKSCLLKKDREKEPQGPMLPS
ncbi:hypothetical protein Tco_0968342 [Tanacetum coccineum]